jgi:hypothetical protein
MVKDQRLDTVPRALDSRRTRRRWQTAGSIVIVVVAFAVIVVPHFLSMSPTTG